MPSTKRRTARRRRWSQSRTRDGCTRAAASSTSRSPPISSSSRPRASTASTTNKIRKICMKYTVQEAAVPAVSARAEQPLAVEHARTLAEVVDVVTRTYVEFRTARKREELVERPRDAAQLLELAVGRLLAARGVERRHTLKSTASSAGCARRTCPTPPGWSPPAVDGTSGSSTERVKRRTYASSSRSAGIFDRRGRSQRPRAEAQRHAAGPLLMAAAAARLSKKAWAALAEPRAPQRSVRRQRRARRENWNGPPQCSDG